MKFKLLITSLMAAGINSAATAQSVDLKSFNHAVGAEAPFTLRIAGPTVIPNEPERRASVNLADEFADLGRAVPIDAAPDPTSVSSPLRMPLRTEISPRGGSQFAPGSVSNMTSPACAVRTYAPSLRLPASAQQRRATWYASMAEAACEAGVPVDLFDALIIQESRYSPVAVSPKGAAGLAQLMPSSARILGVRNVWDPRENMRGGARYLRSLLDEFGRFDLALAAYNAGAGRVRATRRVPRIPETMHYVSGILVTMQRQLALSMASESWGR